MKKTEKYLVIGHPIGHSRSPGMQNAAFAALQLPGHYTALHVEPEKLGEFIAYARENLAGVNLTVPFKQQVFAHFGEGDAIDPAAQRCGSINTLKIVAGHLHGYSTDGYGLEMALKVALHQEIAGKRLLFLGAGGAARATAFHLAEQGAAAITIANRTLSKAEALCWDIASFYPSCQLTPLALEQTAALRRALASADILIQATSVGLPGQDQLVIPEALLAEFHGVIFDTIYRETALQRYAALHHIPCADGKEMLIYQGAKAFELWTNCPAPLDAMRRGFDAPQNPGDFQ